jgi:ADP-ribosylglycohydrolase
MSFSIPADYVERVYAGLLGKNIGIRLGAPVEPAIWTYERIREVYGDVTSYLKPYRNFAEDDDANGRCTLSPPSSPENSRPR